MADTLAVVVLAEAVMSTTPSGAAVLPSRVEARGCTTRRRVHFPIESSGSYTMPHLPQRAMAPSLPQPLSGLLRLGGTLGRLAGQAPPGQTPGSGAANMAALWPASCWGQGHSQVPQATLLASAPCMAIGDGLTALRTILHTTLSKAGGRVFLTPEPPEWSHGLSESPWGPRGCMGHPSSTVKV
jgi:hypothetical protein